VPEQLLHLGIDENDLPFAIHHDDSVGRGFQ